MDVTAHDAYYLEEKRNWKRRIAGAHQDRLGLGVGSRVRKKADGQVRRLIAARKRWQAQEWIYYLGLGLDPPDGKKAPEGLVKAFKSRGKRLRRELVKG